MGTLLRRLGPLDVSVLFALALIARGAIVHAQRAVREVGREHPVQVTTTALWVVLLALAVLALVVMIVQRLRGRGNIRNF